MNFLDKNRKVKKELTIKICPSNFFQASNACSGNIKEHTAYPLHCPSLVIIKLISAKVPKGSSNSFNFSSVQEKGKFLKNRP